MFPELFFFTANNKFDAQMHIYTFNGKEAVELSYDGFNEGAYSGKFADQQAAAGTSYVVYKGKDANTYTFTIRTAMITCSIISIDT